MRIALRLEYDGTDFHGSQLQRSGRTVQSVVEAALEALFKTPVRPNFASRTDAGVHARDQVAAFNVETQLDMETVRNALNHHLPADVAVRSAQRVSCEFDPRRDAEAREYVYTVNNGPYVSPISRRFEAHIPGSLDVVRMDEASRLLEGTQDFAAFAGHASASAASTVRRMYAASSRREGDRVLLTFRANAFLNQQVRRMTAALVSVGRSSTTVERFGNLLAAAVRGSATSLMPARGLCLSRIGYVEDRLSQPPDRPAL